MALARTRAWSSSSLAAWEKCPQQYMREKLQKEYVPQSAALEHGIKVHQHLENVLRGKEQLAPEFEHLTDVMQRFISLNAVPEAQWAFDRSWRPCGWFDSVTWFRAKIDVHYYASATTVSLTDWKTGKRDEHNPKHADQVEQYALAAFAGNERVDTVYTQVHYVEHDEDPICFEPIRRDRFADLRDKWSGRVAPMFADSQFAATPGWHCGGCYFSAANNGPCASGADTKMWKNYYNSGGEVYRGDRK